MNENNTALEDTKNITKKDQVYYSRESLQKAIVTEILPKLKKAEGDISKIKQDLIEQSQKIHPAITEHYHDLKKIEETLKNLRSKIDPKSNKQVVLYNSLIAESNPCFDLPTGTDGRWYSYDIIDYNRCYICEITELAVCINQNIADCL
jgi:hypothetical protein